MLTGKGPEGPAENKKYSDNHIDIFSIKSDDTSSIDVPNRERRELIMEDVNFQHFRIKHRAWKTKLRSFLEGKGGLTVEQATSYKDCTLGKWMYSGGLNRFGSFVEMQKLEKVHIQLHETVKRIITLKTGGNADDAEKEYANISPMSDEIVELLTVIEKKVKAQKTA